MDTDEIKSLLFDALQHPTKKRMACLAERVIELCDVVDSQQTLSGIIKAGDDSLERSFDMLNKLMEAQRKI